MRFFLVFFLAFCTIQSYAQRYVPDQAFSLDGRVSALQIEGRQAIATSEGTAYFFEQQDDRQWVPVDTVSSPVEDEFFGSNVSLAANRAMIAGGNSAYIYEKRGGIWTLISQLDDLGEEEAVPTVAISEDYAFAGLSQEDGANGEQRVGVVIVFAREIQDWQEVQRLRASNGGTNEFFGSAVIVQGRQLVVGNSTFLDSNAPTNGAYLFSINERGEWLETETLEGFFQFEDSANPAYAFNQGNVAIGNSGTFASGFNLPGEVIIYEQQNNAWQQTIIIRPSDSENNDNFGREVVLFRNLLAVQTQNKGTYLYENTKFSEWEEIQILQDYYIADVSSRGAIAYGPDPNSVYFIRRLDNPSDPVFVPSQSFSLENSMRFATTAQLKDDQAIVNGGGEAYIF
ncbi:MAG: FG-GAP repeat protein, partial [Bacteroidota bacterium]